MDVPSLIQEKFDFFELCLNNNQHKLLGSYAEISTQFNELKQKVIFYSSDVDKLNLLWCDSFGSNEDLFTKDELLHLRKNPIRQLFKKMVSKLCNKSLSSEDLTKPIGYAYDPKAIMVKQSSGFVSYELIEQDRNLVINGKRLSDKLPEGKPIRIPKGFEITKICGGGSGSVNFIIYNERTNQRFL